MVLTAGQLAGLEAIDAAARAGVPMAITSGTSVPQRTIARQTFQQLRRLGLVAPPADVAGADGWRPTLTPAGVAALAAGRAARQAAREATA